MHSALDVYAIIYLCLIVVAFAAVVDFAVEESRKAEARGTALASRLQARAAGRPRLEPARSAARQFDGGLVLSTVVIAAVVDVVCRQVGPGHPGDLLSVAYDTVIRAAFAAFVGVGLRLFLLRRGPRQWRTAPLVTAGWIPRLVAIILIVAGCVVGAD